MSIVVPRQDNTERHVSSIVFSAGSPECDCAGREEEWNDRACGESFIKELGVHLSMKA